MITTETGRVLGTLQLETRAEPEGEGAGSPGRTMYQPAGTPMLNDGRWHHWMTPGQDYDTAHDGRGWVVTCRTWPADGHTWRLATADFQMAVALPLRTDRPLAYFNVVTLDAARRYRLQCVGGYEWTLVELP